MYKAFIIGCGQIAGARSVDNDPPRTHAAAIVDHPAMELALCTDTSPRMAQDFADRYGCAVAQDIRSGLSAFHPDLACVCTPDGSHFDIVMEVLAATHSPPVIFLEKPAGKDADQLRRMSAYAERCGVAIVVNHTRRFDARHQELKKRIGGGEFGALHSVDAVYYGGWLHNGVHVVDTLSFLMGDNLHVTSVTGALPGHGPSDPTLEAELAFDRLPGRIRVSGIDERLYQLFEFDLRFERACIRIEDFGEIFRMANATVNDAGERVLTPFKRMGSPARQTAMQRAYERIRMYLDSRSVDTLNGVLLGDAIPVMNTIWEGYDAYRQLVRTP